ncbi:unnamed protein product [Triticum turgidum subsp. durum]|uniref:Uncharacterized protein n=1 Tax=Triticum turgidum subsp. durum TaxID=4567 RepID=A0A9R0TUT1_TRITD|nr:unnamed protein product [Triticum turgidum subsp. durum]
MNREFANVIVRDYGCKFYSLLRVNLKQHLFHRSAAAAEKASNNKKGLPSAIPSLEPLPEHKINFSTPPMMEGATDFHFFSLLKGQAEGRVMFAPTCGNPVMYDIDMDAVVAMPDPNFCKQRDSISLSMTRPGSQDDDEQHYVLSKEPGNVLFEVLEYGRNGSARGPSAGIERRWHWQHLPSPPMRGPYLPDLHRRAVFHPSAAAVVDETTLCVSSVDAGAYAFDTVKGEWRQAGSWALPFHGAAEYVPELGLWFGVNAAVGNTHHCLGAFDLSSWPPVEHRTWNYLDPLSDKWSTWQRHLLNLGSGKFCIATSFQNIQWHTPCYPLHGLDDEMVVNDLTILTGVEVVRCGDGLKMINHKSKRFEGIEIHCVL